MSNALAIAAVTAVLRDLLQNALIDHDVVASVGEVKVSVTSPGLIVAPTDGQIPSQLNLFLYQVLGNSGWSNVSQPARGPSGERLSNPPLALDLRYLLSAYGVSDFDAEILLGYGMQILHETPVLPRDAIRTALAPPGPISGSILAPAFQALLAADLADQVEQIKITPLFLGVEEMSQLWSTFQTAYRPSTAYHVSVVLIESKRSTRATLPVQKYGLFGLPFHLPQISSISPPAGLGQPILAGADLIIRGERLRGTITRLQLDSGELEPASEDVSDGEICIAPGTLRAGVHALQVVHYIEIGDPPRLHRNANSNIAAFLLHPAVVKLGDGSYDITVAGVADTDEGREADLSIHLTPAVGRSQRAVLLLYQFNTPAGETARSYSFFAAPWPAPPQGQPAPQEFDTVTFHAAGMVPGTYLVRVQVDGAESGLELDNNGRYAQPRVTI
jgi:hypothetical protein